MEPITIAQNILSTHFEIPVYLHLESKLRSSIRTNVWRCSVHLDHPHVPRTVIVKQATQPYGTMFDGAIDGSTWQEWAGLQFLTELVPNASIPKFYGGNVANGLIVTEDFGEQANLADLLVGDDSIQAKEALVQYFTTLGTFHTQLMGQESQFHRIRSSLGEYSFEHDWYQQRISRTVTIFQTMIEHLDIPLTHHLENDLNTLVNSLQNPGSFLTFVHGDPSPTNILWVEGKSRLIDFEYSTYSHALLDGVQARIPFPTGNMVNRMPTQIRDQAEIAYRSALIDSCPEAADDCLFHQSVMIASAYWTICFLTWLPFAEVMKQDRQWGISTLRQRYLYFTEVAAQTSQDTGYLEVLGETFHLITTKLKVLWPETESLAVYPAFRKSGAD